MKHGFTLIELLVVVLIIGILAAIALPMYEKAIKKTRMTEAIINVRAIHTALEAYKMANGSYPSTTAHEWYNFSTSNELTEELGIDIAPIKTDWSLLYYKRYYVGYKTPDRIYIIADWRTEEHGNGVLFCSMPAAEQSTAKKNLCLSICSKNEFEEFGDAIGCRI